MPITVKRDDNKLLQGQMGSGSSTMASGSPTLDAPIVSEEAQWVNAPQSQPILPQTAPPTNNPTGASLVVSANPPPPPQNNSMPTLESYLSQGKTAEQWFAETGQQNVLDSGNYNPQGIAQQVVSSFGNPNPNQTQQNSQLTMNDGGSESWSGAAISSEFGAVGDAKRSSAHRGIDISIKQLPASLPTGSDWVITKVYNAATQGQNANDNSGWGNMILATNPVTGETVRLSHLDIGGVFVQPGQTVAGGTIVGRTGNTGNAQGTNGGWHLDIETTNQAGQLINPRLSNYGWYWGI